MTRPRFDPGKAKGPDAGGTPPARRERKAYANPLEAAHLTVSQVSELIRTTLEGVPSPLRVIGEVSNMSAMNHWFFSLKDDASVLSCVAWASTARKLEFTPANGDEVVATGHLSHYGPQGRTQLYVSDIKPVGAGALDLKFKALCEELRRSGYFEESRKRPLPILPRRIAVITAGQSAAWADVVTTASQRCRAVGLVLVDVRVQGDGAAEQVADAIAGVDRHKGRLGVDAILVTRGGGSREDLWTFNERVVADAVFRCSLPVVAAIGHESDSSIIELVADVRASTPTQAIMRLVPSSADLVRQLDHFSKRTQLIVARRIDSSRQLAAANEVRWRQSMVTAMHVRHVALERLSGRLEKVRPLALVSQRRARLAVIAERIARAMMDRVDQHERLDRLATTLHRAHQAHMERSRHRLESIERVLAAIDPVHVLQRGFAIAQRSDGSIVRSVHDIDAGEPLATRVSDGVIHSTVSHGEAIAHSHAGKRTARRGVQRQARRKERRARPEAGSHGPPPDQLDLFGS